MRSGHPFPSLSRYTSLFLLLTFTLQTISSSSIYAAVTGGVEDHDSHSHQAGRPDLAHLNLPRELGSIDRIHKAGSDRTVVLIQDAHAVGAAQTSIQKILQHLIEEQNISLVALEGASQPFDPFFLRSFPDIHKRAEVLERYVQSGEISGAVGAAVLSGRRAEFAGIENQNLYEEGIDLFLTGLQQKEEALHQLKPIQEKISEQKKEIYSKELLELDQIEKAFEGTETITALKEMFRKETVDSGRFPHLAALQKELGTEQSSNLQNKKALLDFFQKLSAKVKDHRIWSPISAKKQEYLTEQISESDFASSMIQAAQSAAIDVPSAVRNIASAYQQIQTMRGEIFYEECRQYLAFLRDAKIQNENQRQLAAFDHSAKLLEKLIQLKISRKEWQEIQTLNAGDSGLAGWSETLLSENSAYVRFYRNAEAREQALFENLKYQIEKTPQAAMITGGFHTLGFLEKLEKEKISYVLISPAISSLQGEENYANRMQGQVSWKSYFEQKNGRINLAEAFSRAVRDDMIAESGPEMLKVWRDNIVRSLADEKRAAETANYTRYIDEKTGKQISEKSAGIWHNRIERFISDLTALKNQNQLSVGNLQRIVSASGIPDGFAVPATIPASWADGEPRINFESIETTGRSESRGKKIDYAALKGLDRLQNATVISLQMEMGYSNGFLKAVEAAYGKQVADQVSQASLTGGLGALMHDLFPSWKANGLDIIGIHPIWDEIKKKPYPEGPLHLGKFQRDIMKSQMAARGEETIKFTVDLPWDDAYKNYAQGNEKARNAFGRKIHYEVFVEHTSQYDAPQYHLYAYYLKDEKGEDAEANQVAIFDTVYSDDHPAWRDLHMAIYARGAEMLIQELKKKGVVKQNTAEIHNEVFVSLPKAQSDPNRIMIHINHSAYQPTIYSPSVNSFGLFGFQPWMKPHIVKDNGKFINLVDYAALAYDMLTGVAIDEHYTVLRRNIFRNAGSRLDFHNDGRIRSTNGVLTEHWQSAALQALIENYRIQLNLPETVDSVDFYEALGQNAVLREEFITRQEFIKSADIVKFLAWMTDVQNQPAWLNKTTNESGRTRQELEAYAAAVLRAAQSHDAAEWELIASNAALRDLLLSRPMSSNVRRQVPYKGPEKWSELLEGLKSSPEKLAKFKETKVRQIIGGRTFSADADKDFQRMKQLVQELGLEDHFAFIENYNVYDAAYMFQAMAGVVMLSDEFLEASATSMMKGVVNGAALIGVWGGAMPELFKIVDENNNVINIFEKKTPHNLVLRNLKNGKWKLVNGYMVRYTAEQSRQAGGGRRPDAEALLSSLHWLHDQYADPAKRRELLWQSVSETSRVDMREGQARAHMHLMEKALAERERRTRLFDELVFSQPDVEKILDPSAEKFVWRRNSEQLLKPSEATSPGILGLVETFRQISTYGAGDERGMAAVDAIRHHAMNGDIFNFILSQLNRVSSSPNLKSLIDEIKSLAAEAKNLPASLTQIKADPEMEDEYRKGLERLSNLNIQAIELLERFGLWMAEKSLDAYFSEQETPRFNQKVLSNILLRRYLARFLEGNPDVITLDTQNSLIKAFGLIRNGEPHIFAINIGSPVTYGAGNKARGGDIIHSAAWNRYLSQFVPDYENKVLQKQSYDVQVTNVKNGEKYGYYNLVNPTTKISLGIPEPEGVQLLKLEQRKGAVATLMVSTGKELDGQFIVDFVTQIHSQALASDIERADNSRGVLATSERIDQEKLDELLKPLAELSVDDASRQFGRYMPTVMALIAGLSPKHLDLIKSWDPFAYASLKKIQAENQKLFNEGEINFHGTNLHTSIVFSRSLNGGAAGENIIFALQFSEGPVNHQDGKVWLRVRSLGDENHPLRLLPKNEYEVRNLLGDVTYSRIRTGEEFFAGWDIGIPVADHYERSEKARHDWGFDVYQIRSVTPRFDLMPAPAQAEPAAHTVRELMLSVNLPDLGAEYDPRTGTVQTYAALDKLAQLVPAISASGIGRVYLVGPYEKGTISNRLHNLPHDGIHFIGDKEEGLPRVMVSIGGYRTKQRGNLRDNHGNIFSPVSMLTMEPKHSATHLHSGTQGISEKLLAESAALLNQRGIQSITDFIFWRAPESVNSTNYKQYFYRELTADEKEDWDELTSDEDKAKFMRQMVRDGGQFAVRIQENGVERLILVRYMHNEPGHDQAVRNIFHPDVMAQSKKELEKLIDLGFSGIRIDLAHKLLNSELKGMFETWKDWNGQGYDPAREPLKELIDHAKQYAKSKNQTFYVVGESYMTYHHDELRKLGFDAVYYENFHRDYFKLASGNNGISAQHFGEVIAHAANNKHLLAFPSNFDVAPLKQANGQREAFLLALVILARAGAPVMIDAREMMDQSGHLIPVPGSEHPFSDDDDIQRRRDFDRYRWQFEQSPFLRLTERFLNLLDGRKLTSVKVLDNENREQFITLDLQFEEGRGKNRKTDHLLVVLNMKPSDDRSIWSSWPYPHPELVDAVTGERFQANGEKANGIPMPSNIQYRILAPSTSTIVRTAGEKRSEVRDVVAPVVAAMRSSEPLSAVSAASFVEAANGNLPDVVALVREFAASQQTFEKFYEAHSDYEQYLDQAIRDLTAQSVKDARAYLTSHADGQMNYAAAFSIETITPKNKERVLQSIQNYIQTVREIQQMARMDFPKAKVEGNIQILMTPDQAKDDAFKDFRKAVDASGVAQRLVAGEAGGLMSLERFLNSNENALIYGVTDAASWIQNQALAIRIVDSEMPVDAILPAGLILSNRLAVDSFKVTGETIKQIPDYLPGIIVWNGTELQITSGVLDLVYQDYLTHSYVLIMA